MPYVDIQHDILNSWQAGYTAWKPVLRTDVGFDSKQGFGNRVQTPAFGATIAFDLSLGPALLIVASASTAITISAPTNIPNIPGLQIYILIKNTSGGAMGAVTLNAAYKVPATAPFATPPTNGENQMASWINWGTQAAPLWYLSINQSTNSGN